MTPLLLRHTVPALAVLVWALAPAAALTDAQGPTGTIRGRVEIQRPVAGAGPRPNAAALGMPAPHDHGERRQSVVYLETAPRRAFDAPGEPRARLDQRNETFVPRLLAIVAGTTVEFPNSDVTYHNVFSFSKTRSFDLGRYAAGRSRSVRFDQPGIVRVFCDIHSHMSAHILVFAHRYFTVAGEAGRYRLDGVPPGTYTVVAWNESARHESRQVVIGGAGGDAEVNFRLGAR